jgi:hypothetical protein
VLTVQLIDVDVDWISASKITGRFPNYIHPSMGPTITGTPESDSGTGDRSRATMTERVL